MAYRQPLPPPPQLPPPEEIKHMDLFGVANGLWRFSFLSAYFGIVALTLRSMAGASLGQIIILHLCWWACARMLATSFLGLCCEFANEEAQQDHAKAFEHAKAEHAKALVEAMQRLPVKEYRFSDATGELEPQYDLPESAVPPLISPDMGVRPRH